MKTPTKDFSTRFSRAKRYRDAVRSELEEVLQFICPGREKDFSQALKKSVYTDDYETETYNSLPEELASDFASDLVTYYTPAEVRWAEYLVTTEIPEEAEDAVRELVQDREDKLFDLVSSSNYNDIAPQIMFEAGHGTVAAWVQAGHFNMPVHVECVPPHELYITPGYMGVLDRFREKMCDAQNLEALFTGWDVDLSDPKITAKMKKPGELVRVCWGFWVDWSDAPNPIWRCEITVDGHRVTPTTPLTLGPLAGSCPLLVGRFNPQVDKPWGRGPGRKALRDFRTGDKISEIVLSGLDQSVMTTLIYPDDGLLDLGDGIEPGRAYPGGRNFTRDQIFELQKGVNLDYGFFSEESFEEKWRRAFYQDGPRQRGETPPTASQWLDERRRTQQRLGKPSAPLWTEFFFPMIQRFEFLGVELGKIPEAISHDGENINVMPISPLQKAQNQDKVLVSRSNLELAVGVFGENLPVDMVQTFRNIVDASGDELTVVAEPQEPAVDPTQTPQ